MIRNRPGPEADRLTCLSIPTGTLLARLAPMLTPYPAEVMRVWPVSDRVNGVGHDGPDLLEQAGKTAPRQGSLV